MIVSSMLPYPLPTSSEGEPSQSDLVKFLVANRWKGYPDGRVARCEFSNLADFVERLGVEYHCLREIQYLRCPSNDELDSHLLLYGTQGSQTPLTDAQYSQCLKCACFTSFLQAYGTLRVVKRHPRIVRMTDGTFGFLKDSNVCLIMTGLLGTHIPSRTKVVSRKIWVNGYVLCGKGETKIATFVLTVALKLFWQKLFGISDKMQANHICLDNLRALILRVM